MDKGIDIQSRADIEFLVDSFYKKVLADALIGYIFNDVVELDLSKHMPIMYSFWESILLDTMSYKGNPMLKHIELNLKEALLPQHFERWLQLWEATVGNNFAGEKADEAIRRAKLMAQLMQHKISESASDKFIQ